VICSLRSLLISLFAIIFVLPTFASGAGFISSRIFPSGGVPLAAVSADFNNDGHPDIATADNGGTVSVLLGTGNGFGPSTQYAIPGGASALAAGDLNGDGNLDLAVAGYFSGVTILLGNGNGTFTVSSNFDPLFSLPVGVALGDVNGDGKLDLLVADNGVAGCDPGAAIVVLGNGDGTFLPATSYSVGLANPQSISVGDLNKDGKLDLVTANDSSFGPVISLSVLLGNGDGTFQSVMKINAGTSPDWVEIADLNGDTIPDLVVANLYGNSASTLFGNGNGTFQAPTSYQVSGSATTLTLADLDNDGIPDLLVVGSSGVNILKGKAGGTFGTAVLWSVGNRFVAAGNFTGSAALDVVAGGQNSVNLAAGNGTGRVRAARGYSLGSLPDDITVGDYNGDGKADMAVIKQNIGGSLAIFLGNGNGTFQKPLTTSLGNYIRVISADFNGDSKLDLALSAGAVVQILLGNGDGTFTKGQAAKVASTARSEVAADFNHDGHPDIAAANEDTSNISVLIGNGDGTFQNAVNYAAGQFPESVVTADFNRDGKLDLAVANPFQNTVSLLLGNGDGTFQSRLTTPFNGPSYLAAADFNGDGNKDLFVTGSDGELLLGNGDGTFQPGVSVLLADGPVKAVDINRDGKIDLVISDLAYTNLVTLLVGNGHGTFQAPTTYFAGIFNSYFAVADFNGDRFPDLGVIDTSTDVFVLLNAGQ
jgi:hypothetical protein